MIVLRPTTVLPEGLEAGVIRPDLWASLSHEEILRLPLVLGRHRYALGDLFRVTGQRSDDLVIEGDAAALAGLGAGMGGGRLLVRGTAGARTGADMRGGELLVESGAGPCTGLGMRGGTLRVRGDAGPRVGGAWPGESGGMRGGRLIVEGNAGERLGERMRRGVIVCHGAIGETAAPGMRGGTIVALGTLGRSFGAGMNRGTIVVLGGKAPLWPAFRYDCLYDPVVVRLYLRALDLRPPGGTGQGAYRRYHGDVTALGKGEVLLWQQAE